jgi:hypothetical protein
MFLPNLQVATGLSCPTHVANTTDSWQTIAVRYKVGVIELIRSNPNITASVTNGTRVFIPPCNSGALQGTKRSNPKP